MTDLPVDNFQKHVFIKTYLNTSKPLDDALEMLLLIKEIENRYPIDKNKIYLVGYSMEASTVQNLMNISPRKFAALVSIAAVPDFSNPEKLKHKNQR